jgi:hypothetical protein
MKNLLVKIVLTSAVLASTLPAASAMTHRQMRLDTGNSATGYGVATQSSQAAGWNSRWVDDEQARRDIESQGG